MSVIYINGFETGGALEMATLGAGASIVTSPVRSGGYALKQASTTSNLVTGQSLTHFSARFYVRMPAGLGANIPLFTEGPAGVTRVNLRNNSGKLQVIDGSATLGGISNGNGVTNWTADVWHLIDISVDLTFGIININLDGKSEIRATFPNNVSGSPTAILRVGGGATPNECFFDDVQICDTPTDFPIGEGKIIARQGIAGTPTYDAWAKSGAATAALCLSDTPFSTATKITSSTSGAKQTMLIGSFSAAGNAAEGSDVIGAHDVINACKIGVIAKRASAGFAYIKRIVGGAENSVVASLTTADAYYDDIAAAAWTDTLINLNAMEAGIQHEADTVLATVEDLWVMVDYTPKPSAPFKQRGMPKAILAAM